MKQPHPHAELMLQYAKDCAEDFEAYLNWEYRSKFNDNEWKALDKPPVWANACQYRRKPELVQVLTDDQIKKITKEYRLRIFSNDIFADTFIEMARAVIEFHEKVKQANQSKD